MRATRITPVGAIVRGLVAGAIGTAVFTGYQTAKSRLTNGGGGDSGPPESWDEASTPAKAGKKFLEGVFDEHPKVEHIPALSQAMHWGFGVAWGPVYGIMRESFKAHPIVQGAALGSLVVAFDYTALPAMKLYSPPWEYSPKTLATDLGNHLVYGLGVAGGYELVSRRVAR